MMQKVEIEESSPAEFVERFINQTDQSVFLTGRAGTGKTTLLKAIIQSTYKNTTVAAPTGIAALNAGGVTIHSLFQLPFGAFIPEFGQPPYAGERIQFNTKTTLQQNHFRVNKRMLEVVRRMELLIIDEVSMLRADLLDAIDFKLRKTRRIDTPFGGVQVLFIGDLLQLPPIVKREEESVLKKYYRGSFFFHAHVIQEQPPLYIELEKIYRQNDPEFIGLLDELRNNKISSESIKLLNQYVRPNFDSTQHEGFITITTHNRKADEINQKSLQSLGGKARKYTAEIAKKFPESIYPIPALMELKVGAQVMFIKNDLSFEKRFYNGKIGRIASLDGGEVKVSFPNEKLTVSVEKYEWENVKYSLDNASGEIKEELIGTFVQYPLKLAWAITVHKSQGLTFEKAVLDLSGVFAPGQAYVGLSRLTSLKGLVLLAPIQLNGLKNDYQVVDYAKSKASKNELMQKLETGTVFYLQKRLQKTFNWEETAKQWVGLEIKHKSASERSEMGKNKAEFVKQSNALMATLEPSRKFRGQIAKLCQPYSLNLRLLHERFEAAYHYFIKILEPIYRENIKQLLLLGRKSNVKQYMEELTALNDLLTETILEIKKSRKLIEQLRQGERPTKSTIWDSEIQNYRITKLQAVKEELQRTNPVIGDVDEFTFVKIKASNRKVKKPKESTYQKTFDLFSTGKSIAEIANERSLTKQTIYNHLGKLIKEEKLELKDVMEAEKIVYLKATLGDLIEGSLTDAKATVGDKITWGELHLYQSSLLR